MEVEGMCVPNISGSWDRNTNGIYTPHVLIFKVISQTNRLLNKMSSIYTKVINQDNKLLNKT